MGCPAHRPLHISCPQNRSGHRCRQILSLYHQFIAPDITAYLEVSADAALKRLSAIRHNVDIYDKLEKLKSIARGYEWLIRKFPRELTVIDGSKSIDKVSEELFEKVVKITS